jgi:hypothetical protein
MQATNARAQSFKAILAFVAVAASGTAAAQPGSDTGLVSRASLQIRVSVAERVGVRFSPAHGLQAAEPCIVSTATARTFAATLEPIGRPGGPPGARSFEIAAASPGQACGGNEDLRDALATLSKDGSSGAHLLILAPQ